MDYSRHGTVVRSICTNASARDARDHAICRQLLVRKSPDKLNDISSCPNGDAYLLVGLTVQRVCTPEGVPSAYAVVLIKA